MLFGTVSFCKLIKSKQRQEILTTIWAQYFSKKKANKDYYTFKVMAWKFVTIKLLYESLLLLFNEEYFISSFKYLYRSKSKSKT